MSSTRVWSSDQAHVQLSCSDVLYVYQVGHASTPLIDNMVRGLKEVLRESKRPIAYILHVARTATPPTSEDRRRVHDLINSCAKQIAGVALVVEADGFAGAVLRSATAMVFVIKRNRFSVQTFADLPSAAAWLSPLTGVASSEIVELAHRARVVLSAAQTSPGLAPPTSASTVLPGEDVPFKRSR